MKLNVLIYQKKNYFNNKLHSHALYLAKKIYIKFVEKYTSVNCKFTLASNDIS